MNPDRAKRLLAESSKRQANRSKVDFAKLCFKQQLAFVQDPSKQKVALCSRRAGKTQGVAYLLIATALKYQRVLIPYITLTRGTAKNIIWLILQEICRDLDIEVQLNQQTLTVTFKATGSTILLLGADDEGEIERLRGGKYPLVVIDEAQSFRPYIRNLIKDVIRWALMDYNGTLVVTGTPGKVCAGFFYEVSTGQDVGWSIHSWTVLDNPHVDAAGWLKEQKGLYGLVESDPAYIRECLGKWVYDANKLVYRLRPYSIVTTNLERSKNTIQYVLGLDLGFVDSTAFVVLSYDEHTGNTRVVRSYKQTGLIPSAVAAHVERLRDQYPGIRIVADTGGLGKGYVEEMKQRFHIPIKAAEKKNKLAYIDLLNGDLASNRLHLDKHGNEDLLYEMNVLTWNDDHSGPVEGPGMEDHLCDALLYGWRECKAFLHEDQLNKPKVYSKEWFQEMEDKMEKNAIEEDLRASHVAQREWWDKEDSEEDQWSPY